MTAGTRDLEHDIEASRARLDGTLNRLQARLNPAAIVEEVVGTARRSEAGAALYHSVPIGPAFVEQIEA